MSNNIPLVTEASQDIDAIDYAYSYLKECLRLEVLNKRGKRKFSWLKVISRVMFSYKKRYRKSGASVASLQPKDPAQPENFCTKNEQRYVNSEKKQGVTPAECA